MTNPETTPPLVPPHQGEGKQSKKLDKAALISLSFELGYIIAIPLVFLGLLGKWADARLEHSFPWMTLLGIGLAMVATVIWIIQNLKKYINK
ncbi:MAG: hypothetical protein A3C49_01450 [Candidatus Doudnabacteria bacterium RIFCSPHIGHO2_02_FULL_42_25]|uniref:F0F1-ATPase subunit n=1 Tax=Candidatus Doudnabacteria bacterium RIFCSPHIGHO2_01_FULL_41_86 TaxID=1817821 RepID=A0A1F5N967_9BACT|nr:MAG: hypothetical protein A2717_01040 [Candidatus Doudnabacteria bacterium RIFCSPHIGHO2_01_FULL_41_86]OGE75223.1 MAG: hypothetical protein A3K07_00130 [Candidatus Doudnabacteria bacterium RIFCSPHIGHO2_01_43_10]OGE85162.1 MAG: hypothetical protein A3E28_00615 [Candidatus Doudnabacteria bacterium RIFCSPHIGHO2_12_FULL_42_22]OGE86701.1 MAG: hypothetical protein A3C49_01450 [Candidatus Doudnabacteria bacterium RIFCSPHIGHO2_02_FULL_42_25]OGE92298.1 MAG: hypothetical protein A2895_01605 [Candidatus